MENETETDCVRYGTGLLSESNLDLPTTNLTTSSLKRKVNMPITRSLHLDQHESDFVNDNGTSADGDTPVTDVLTSIVSSRTEFF